MYCKEDGEFVIECRRSCKREVVCVVKGWEYGRKIDNICNTYMNKSVYMLNIVCCFRNKYYFIESGNHVVLVSVSLDWKWKGSKW